MSDRFVADACASMAESGMAAMQNDVAISPITVWALTRKAFIGKLSPLPAVDGRFVRWLVEQGFPVRPLTWADTERANALPPIHEDPMDRMLIAQALNADMTVITEDALYPGHGVKPVWRSPPACRTRLASIRRLLRDRHLCPSLDDIGRKKDHRDADRPSPPQIAVRADRLALRGTWHPV